MFSCNFPSLDSAPPCRRRVTPCVRLTPCISAPTPRRRYVSMYHASLSPGGISLSRDSRARLGPGRRHRPPALSPFSRCIRFSRTTCRGKRCRTSGRLLQVPRRLTRTRHLRRWGVCTANMRRGCREADRYSCASNVRHIASAVPRSLRDVSKHADHVAGLGYSGFRPRRARSRNRPGRQNRCDRARCWRVWCRGGSDQLHERPAGVSSMAGAGPAARAVIGVHLAGSLRNSGGRRTAERAWGRQPPSCKRTSCLALRS
jgi:hypothetical protein